MPADDNTRQADAEEGAPRSALLRELGQQSGVSSHPGGLLGHIGSEILNEKRRADRRLQEMVEGMIRLAEESSLDDQVRRVPLIAKVLIVGGVLTLVFAAGVFTPLAEVFDLGWLQVRGQFVLWAFFTALLFGVAVSLLSTARSGQGRPLAVIAIVLLVLACLAAFVPDSDAGWIGRTFRDGYWYHWPISASIALASLVACAVVPYSLGDWRAALARFLRWLTIAYLMVVVVAASASPYSYLQPADRHVQAVVDQWDPSSCAEAGVLEFDVSSPPAGLSVEDVRPFSEILQDRKYCVSGELAGVANAIEDGRHIRSGTRSDLRLLLFGIGLTSFFLGLLAVALLWVRIEFRNRSRGERFAFYQDEAVRASRARRSLQFFLTQWLGTASALSRVVWRPFGEVAELEELETNTVRADEDLLKLQLAKLTLTPSGEDILLARLRSLLVRPGWLNDQYRRAAQAFLDGDAELRASGIPAEEWPQPETCLGAPSIEEALSGNAKGRRWMFARSLYKGELDYALQEGLSDHSPAEIYRSLLDLESAASVDLIAQDESIFEDSPQAFFEAVLPEAAQELPANIVTRPFVANDEARKMQSFVCWPDEMFPDAEVYGHRVPSVSHPGIRGAVVTAVRCDISEPFGSGDFQTIEDEADVAGPLDLDSDSGL